MTTTLTSSSQRAGEAPRAFQWWCWPLRDSFPQSLSLPALVVLLAAAVGYMASSWLVAVIVMGTLLLSWISYFLPTCYEVHPGGLTRRWLKHGPARFVPWRVVRSYQLRSSGLLLFRRIDPTPLDALNSEFLPYGQQPDEVVCAVRPYLAHAEELAGW